VLMLPGPELCQGRRSVKFSWAFSSAGGRFVISACPTEGRFKTFQQARDRGELEARTIGSNGR